MKLMHVIGLVVAASMAQVFGIGPPALANSDASLLSLPPPQTNELVVTGQNVATEHKNTLQADATAIAAISSEPWRVGSRVLSVGKINADKIAPETHKSETGIAKKVDSNVTSCIDFAGIDIWTTWFRPMLC